MYLDFLLICALHVHLHLHLHLHIRIPIHNAATAAPAQSKAHTACWARWDAALKARLYGLLQHHSAEYSGKLPLERASAWHHGQHKPAPHESQPSGLNR